MAKNTSSVSTLDDGDDVAVAQAPVEVVVKGSGHDAGLSGDKVTITIAVSDAEHGELPVEIGLNGVAYQLPRGVSCKVPMEVVEVLKNAVVTRHTNLPGGGVKESNAMRFQWMVG